MAANEILEDDRWITSDTAASAAMPGVADWLRYDWFGAGTDDPQGAVTFGRYRGHDRIVYRYETRPSAACLAALVAGTPLESAGTLLRCGASVVDGVIDDVGAIIE